MNRLSRTSIDGRVVAAATLCAALLAPVAVFTTTREEAAREEPRPTAPIEAPTDPATSHWEYLRGGAPPQTTPMQAPAALPRIRQLSVQQYRTRPKTANRAGATTRVYRDRPPNYRPVAIVLHATGGGTPGSEFASLGALWRFFNRPAADASAHYAIDRSGRIAQFVGVDAAAFHVATPGWNDVSIGIELLNDNTGDQPFTPAQLRATTQLVRWLGSTYAIPVEGVVRHRTVQPADRSDPASNFPWQSWLRTLRVR